MFHKQLFIGGSLRTPCSGKVITVRSASTEAIVGACPAASTEDVDYAVTAARRAFDDPNGWPTWESARRAAALESLATELDRHGEEIASLVSTQNGMPITQSRASEAKSPQSLLRLMANLARQQPIEESAAHMRGGTSTVRHEPMGVVAGIVPWNYPQALGAFKYAAALAAGCTVVLKPSPETVLDSYVFAHAVAKSDLPAGVLNIVPGDRHIGAYLVRHPAVDRVAFTGSTAAGRTIAEVCGRLLRPVSLELGGKSAAIILDDADLDLARIRSQLVAATLSNNGQTCRLCTRILAPRRRYRETVDLLEAMCNSLIVGDALDPATEIGPVVSSAHRDRVERYIATGKAEGARLVAGGERPPGQPKGWFVSPTLFAEVDNRATIAREEIFGPVLAVIEYENDEDAIRIANDSEYGLAGTVWTTDPDRGGVIARKVHTGTFGVNRYAIDPASPFGGIKASGLGRELGPDALRDFQNVKAIYA